MGNKAGLNGLAQSHFIGKQHAWRQAIAHLAGNVELVRDQVDTAANEPAHGRLTPLMHHLQRAATQRMHPGFIEMSAAKAFFTMTRSRGLPRGASAAAEQAVEYKLLATSRTSTTSRTCSGS